MINHHSKDVNLKFQLKLSSRLDVQRNIYIAVAYILLCKPKGTLDKYNIYLFVSCSKENFKPMYTNIFS